MIAVPPLNHYVLVFQTEQSDLQMRFAIASSLYQRKTKGQQTKGQNRS